MRNSVTEADRKKVQALAESGEATKMIDALIKASPEKAAEMAETRLEMQKARLSALGKENPDRMKILFWQHKDEMRAFGDNKAAQYDWMISMIEQDKIKNPNHTQTFEEFTEEEKRRRLETMIDQRYESHKANIAQASQGKDDGNGSLILGAFVVGVAACALGAPNLAVASFAIGFMVAEYEEATKGLSGSKGTLKEMTRDEIKENLINYSRAQGKTEIADVLTR